MLKDNPHYHRSRLGERPHGKPYVPSLQVLARMFYHMDKDYPAFAMTKECSDFTLRWAGFLTRGGTQPNSPEAKWIARARKIAEQL